MGDYMKINTHVQNALKRHINCLGFHTFDTKHLIISHDTKPILASDWLSQPYWWPA